MQTYPHIKDKIGDLGFQLIDFSVNDPRDVNPVKMLLDMKPAVVEPVLTRKLTPHRPTLEMPHDWSKNIANRDIYLDKVSLGLYCTVNVTMALTNRLNDTNIVRLHVCV